MSFQLSPELEENKVFLIDRSELEGRLDPFCYIPELVTLDKEIKSKTNYRLSDFTKFRASGATPSKSHDEYYSDKENGIPFIRVQNLSTTGELDQSNLTYISKDIHNGLLKRSQIKEHDLLVKITGVGRMAVASVAPDGFEGNINQHIVVVRTGSKEISENIASFLNLDAIERIATKRATGGTRPALDYPALFSIPVINDRKFHAKIKIAVAKKKQKEAEAKNLLDSIDDYLLAELGIELPEQEKNTIQNRMFTRQLSDLSGGRFDPDYFQEECEKLQNSLQQGKFESKEIRHATDSVVNGNTPASTDYSDVETVYPIIKVKSYEGECISFKKLDFTSVKKIKQARKNDIFILSAAHQASYVGRFIKLLDSEPPKNTSFVGELICIRPNEDICNPMYLFSLLNIEVCKVLLNREKTGQTSHIYPTDIKHIKIPMPPLVEQNKFADHIVELRNQAKQLQQQAKEELEQAKKEVEAMILCANEKKGITKKSSGRKKTRR
jgi:restriction endonuclease S subunit